MIDVLAILKEYGIPGLIVVGNTIFLLKALPVIKGILVSTQKERSACEEYSRKQTAEFTALAIRMTTVSEELVTQVRQIAATAEADRRDRQLERANDKATALESQDNKARTKTVKKRRQQ